MGAGTELGQVRGLGSSGHGSGHWLTQRTSAVGNFALMIWFVVSLARLPDLGLGTITMWLSSPLAAIPLMLLVVSVLMHIRMGLQVFIEDYVKDEGLKFASLTALSFYCIGAGATAFFAIAKIAFAATAVNSGMPG
jgi:succinate dehydrogenase / fumarate reductase, membrane anchor subunit